MNNVDEHLNGLVLRAYKADLVWHATNSELTKHLVNCPTLKADASVQEGSYGCDTGCEYARLEAKVFCGCEGVEVDEYTYGSFGDMASLIEDLDQYVKETEAHQS